MTTPAPTPRHPARRRAAAALGAALGRLARALGLTPAVTRLAVRVLHRLDPGHELLARAHADRSTLSGGTAGDYIEWRGPGARVAVLRPRGPRIERGDRRTDPPRTLGRPPGEDSA